MDFPTKEELIASQKTVPEICELIGADSLSYLSKKAMLDSVPHDKGGYCTACFDADYPMKIENELNKLQHEHSIIDVEKGGMPANSSAK